MNTFDPLKQPLLGQHSIEASAGTGKTYSITVLWLRLLIEEDLSVDQILVSTFTTAATAELRERLLASLRNAYHTAKALQRGETPPSSKELDVIQQLPRLAKDGYAKLCLDLAAALSSFDLAPIHTIHGFCQSLITRNALELGCDSSLKLEQSCEYVLNQISDDFLMRTADDPAVEPKALRTVASTVAKYIDAQILANELPDQDALAARIQRIQAMADQEAAAMKGSSRSAFLRHVDNLVQSREWKALSDAQSKAVSEEFNALWAEVGTTLQLCKDFPAAAVAQSLAQTVVREFPARKTAAGIRGFDDILRTVQKALETDGAESALAVAVRKRLKAAIIDECQDSDGTQIHVFEQLFHHAQTRSFIVIGDPKQSIYRFRGADLTSYKRLSKRTTAAPPMTVNHRSDPQLIEAINALYGANHLFPDALAEEMQAPETRYIPVTAKAKTCRIQDPADLKPLVFQWSPETDRALAMNQIASQLAEECRRLLSNNVQVEDKHTGLLRPLVASDIAVIAHFHRDLSLVRRKLVRAGIPCQASGKGAGSVFASDEARDILAWLELLAVMETRGDVLKSLVTFLGTPLGAYSCVQLQSLHEDAEQQASLCSHFQFLLPELARLGPLPLLLRQLASTETAQANLPFAEGERRFANWRQVASLLQHEHGRGRKSAPALRLWLARQISAKSASSADESDTDESTLMRLDTDAPAVQMVTTHNSKGLEYPVVFCPFLWNLKSKADKKPPAILRLQQGWVLDIGSNDFKRHAQLALSQEDEEDHRKLYVALTRPRHRLYVGLAPVSSSKADRHKNAAADSALAKLGGLALEGAEPAEWLAHLRAFTHADVRTPECAPLAREASPSPAKEALPSAPLLKPPQAVPPYPFPFHRVASFSALSKSDQEHASATDHDAESAASTQGASTGEAQTPVTDLLAPLGPGGAALGDQMHLLLEEYLGNHRELDVAVAEIKDGPLWETAVNQILDTQIPLEGCSQTTLRAVRGDCITEMQFHLPTKAFSREKLSSVLEAHPLISCQDACSEWAEGIADWGFHEFDGFLQGYIDLIFQHKGRWFVADYKSNQLASYSKDALEDAMLTKNYLLQARFYALALHRHLQAHLPDYDYDAHFGGIVYLFVRGFPEQGVWFERPPLESLDSLGNLFPTLAP